MRDNVQQDSQPDIQRLVRDSRFIFSGTVVELGASTVANLGSRDNFAAVRVDRSLQADPALGDLRGRAVTVELLDRNELQPGNRAIFFTLNWIQGGGIAAREVAHVNVQQEDDVAGEVALLPERHLAERLSDAVLVVLAEVAKTEPTRFEIRWRNAPQWAKASLRNVDALRGQPTQNTSVWFPTSGRAIWMRAPRLSEGQRGIFLLHRLPDWPPLPESATLTSEAFTALDPADVQPESQRPLVERLLKERRLP